MHQNEAESEPLARDSSQTLGQVPLERAFAEEDQYQLPKQVHAAGEVTEPYLLTDEGAQDRSYKTMDNRPLATKNLKESLDSNMDYRIESTALIEQNLS